ncbi:MAG: hypothetical protein MI746_08880, partial [Pseudomonadales bacterium]|nr:hypothetical protein [Pseudomonadales bacterium]
MSLLPKSPFPSGIDLSVTQSLALVSTFFAGTAFISAGAFAAAWIGIHLNLPGFLLIPLCIGSAVIA